MTPCSRPIAARMIPVAPRAFMPQATARLVRQSRPLLRAAPAASAADAAPPSPKAICLATNVQLATALPARESGNLDVVELPEPVRRALNWDARADEAATPPGLVPDSTSVPPAPPPAEEPLNAAEYAPSLIQGALYVAAAGSGACAVIVALRLIRFRRLLRYAVPAPPAIRLRMEALALRMGVAPPSPWLVPGAICPMVFALGGRPWLLIPDGLWSRLSRFES